MDFSSLIKTSLLPVSSKRRSGRLLLNNKVVFLVAHDTGNPNSSAMANVRYYRNTADVESPSAHIFVDDDEILECIPSITFPADKIEKAWHVLYTVPVDDKLFGTDANDSAIGVEYCYGPGINSESAYSHYVWVLAYLCKQHGLNPEHDIVSHRILDPSQKRDPDQGLAASGRSYAQLLIDVKTEWLVLTGKAGAEPTVKPVDIALKARVRLNLRSKPTSLSEKKGQLVPGQAVKATGEIQGQNVDSQATWYQTAEGLYFWSGGVTPV